MSGVTLAFGWHIGEREENVNKQDDDYGSSQLIIEPACCRNEHDSHTCSTWETSLPGIYRLWRHFNLPPSQVSANDVQSPSSCLNVTLYRSAASGHARSPSATARIKNRPIVRRMQRCQQTNDGRIIAPERPAM